MTYLFNANANATSVVTYNRADSNTQMDTAGRLRVAQSGQQWWSIPSVDADGDLRYQNQSSGTAATVTFVQNTAGVYLTSGTDSTGVTIRASRRRHKVRPGASHVWSCSANFDGVQTNVTKRLGMFTNFNGMFFEVTDDLYVVIRRRLSDGTLAEERVKRTDFNLDKLDGAGPSGYNFNYSTSAAITAHISTTSIAIGATTVWQAVYATTAANNFRLGTKVTVSGVLPVTRNDSPMVTARTSTSITLVYNANPGGVSSLTNAVLTQSSLHMYHSWYFDFEGHRSTHCRFGIMGPQGPDIIHAFDLGNQFGTAFENAPALMERSEVRNTGAVDHLPSLTVHGVSYNVEAEIELNPGFGAARTTVPITYAHAGTAEYPVLGIALRAGEPYQRADLQLQSFGIVDAGNSKANTDPGVFQWRLVLNPTISSNVTTSVAIGKASQQLTYHTSATITGGIELMNGYGGTMSMVDTKTSLNFLNMGSNLDYTDSDKVVLIVKQIEGGAADAKIYAAMNFIESL
jgi:hypothetical protein